MSCCIAVQTSHEVLLLCCPAVLLSCCGPLLLACALQHCYYCFCAACIQETFSHGAPLLCMYHALLLQLLHMLPHCLCLVTEKLHTCPLPARLFLHGWGCLMYLWQVHLCKAEALNAGLLRLNVQVCPYYLYHRFYMAVVSPYQEHPNKQLQPEPCQFPHASF